MTADPAWKIGDVVQLKSGGPPMTINKIIAETEQGGPAYSCVWFNASGELQPVMGFEEFLLKKVGGGRGSTNIEKASKAKGRRQPA